MSSRLSALFLGSALLFTACGGLGGSSTFDTGWRGDRGGDALRIQAELRQRRATNATPVAIGVTGHGLVGRSLPDGRLWNYEGEVNVLPSLAGSVVGFSGNNRITLLDATTGKLLWQIQEPGRRLEGLGYDGETAILLLVDEDDARADQILLVGPGGQRRFAASTLERIGTPAAIQGIGLVPWGFRQIVALDLKNGDTRGRILSGDRVHRVEARQEGVLFWGRGVTPFDAQLATQPEMESLRLPKLNFPGDPVWPQDGSQPRPAQPRAISLEAHPVWDRSGLRFAHDRFAGTYYDIVTGLSLSPTRLQWVTAFERSVIQTVPHTEGVSVCLEDGSLWHLSWEQGAQQPLGHLERRLRACVLHPPDFIPDTNAALPRAPVEQQVVSTITNTSPHLAPIHHFLIEQLQHIPGASATEALLAIARDPLTSLLVTQRASEALAERKTGAPALLHALVQSQPPLPFRSGSSVTDAVEPTEDPPFSPEARQKRPPPIRSLARALTHMEEKRAATPLARYLHAPAIDAEEAQAILDALFALGGAGQATLVFEFFATYRAVGGDPGFLQALAEAGYFAWSFGSPEERAEVEAAARDSLTHPELQPRLQLLLEKQQARTAPSKNEKSRGSTQSR